MNRAQRIVLILYCLLIVYCCLWVPWHVIEQTGISARIGYGWLWIGPSVGYAPYASPDLAVIVLRLIAATALAGAAFLGAHKL